MREATTSLGGTSELRGSDASAGGGTEETVMGPTGRAAGGATPIIVPPYRALAAFSASESAGTGHGCPGVGRVGEGAARAAIGGAPGIAAERCKIAPASGTGAPSGDAAVGAAGDPSAPGASSSAPSQAGLKCSATRSASSSHDGFNRSANRSASSGKRPLLSGARFSLNCSPASPTLSDSRKEIEPQVPYSAMRRSSK